MLGSGTWSNYNPSNSRLQHFYNKLYIANRYWLIKCNVSSRLILKQIISYYQKFVVKLLHI